MADDMACDEAVDSGPSGRLVRLVLRSLVFGGALVTAWWISTSAADASETLPHDEPAAVDHAGPTEPIPAADLLPVVEDAVNLSSSAEAAPASAPAPAADAPAPGPDTPVTSLAQGVVAVAEEPLVDLVAPVDDLVAVVRPPVTALATVADGVVVPVAELAVDQVVALEPAADDHVAPPPEPSADAARSLHADPVAAAGPVPGQPSPRAGVPGFDRSGPGDLDGGTITSGRARGSADGQDLPSPSRRLGSPTALPSPLPSSGSGQDRLPLPSRQVGSPGCRVAPAALVLRSSPWVPQAGASQSCGGRPAFTPD